MSRSATGDRAPGMAANVLSLALVTFFISWRFGLDQIAPGAVLLVGAWRLWRDGVLRWGAEAIVFALFGLWTLTSIPALGGMSELLLYARGEVHLAVALAAYLVALSVVPDDPAFRRFLRLVALLLALHLLISWVILLHLVPRKFPSWIALALPGLETSSRFVNELILTRDLGPTRGFALLTWLYRQSGFFLYQGGLMTVLLLLQGWLFIARSRLGADWRLITYPGLTVVLWLTLLTGSRSGLLTLCGAWGAYLLWQLVGGRPDRRWITRTIVAVLLLAALLMVIPTGDRAAGEQSAAWERLLTNFRIDSFIDRLDVYFETLDRLGERPLTGWGIQGRPGARNRFLRLGTHSELLNVGYRFGWVGLALFAGAGAVYARRLWRAPPRPERAIVIVTVAALAATALVRTFQWDLNVLWLLAAFLGSGRALIAPVGGRAWAADSGARVRMLGCDLDPLTIDGLHQVIARAVESGQQAVIGHQNVHGLYLLPRQPAMGEFFQRADHVFVDGMPLIWLARGLGYELDRSQRVTYADWVDPLAAECARRGWRLFHLGGKPGVGDAARARLERHHPQLVMATAPGYFEPSQRSAILRQIAQFEPDILMVGMGMPRQEAWINDNLDKIDASTILTCGACMDYVAGEVTTPPRWAGRAGLEWLFRLAAEPRRLARRYLVEPWPVIWRYAGEWWRWPGSAPRT